MGTRSLTFVYDGNLDSKPLCCIYRQWDGRPESLGLEHAEFFKGMVVINGISIQKLGEAANGMGCLAAQLVAHMKDDIGSVYIYPTESKDCGEEFVYRIFIDGKPGFERPIRKIEVRMQCETADGKVLFSGLCSEYEAWGQTRGTS